MTSAINMSTCSTCGGAEWMTLFPQNWCAPCITCVGVTKCLTQIQAERGIQIVKVDGK